MKVAVIVLVSVLACLSYVSSNRTVSEWRTLSLREHELEILYGFDVFLDQADQYLKPSCYDKELGDEFSLMRKRSVLDRIFDACIASETLLEESEVTCRRKRELRSDLVKRLLGILKREDPPPACDDYITETDPSELMYDADIQFNNLCVTLFEIRRLNGNEPI